MSRIIGEFSLKSLRKAEKELNTSKSVIIEGFANKAVVDRGNDYIPPEAWKIEEFQKNPIMFFNHDRNVPIGRALEVKVTTEGLKIKAKISKSKAAPMPYIRDMIREQVLRTFSVGFDPMGSEEKREDGVNVIKQANLLEVSVVSIPMNQESDFSLAKGMAKGWRTKDYDSALSDVFQQRGETMLAKLHEIISSRKSSVEGFNRTEVLETIAAKLGIEVLNVESILAGNVDLTDEFIKAFGSVLMVPKSMLKGEDKDEKEEIEEEDDKGGNYDEDEKEDGEDEEMMEDEEDKENMEDEEDKEEESEEEKQAAGLDAAKDDTEFGNPHLTIAKSHLALAGSMVDKLSSVDATMKEMCQLLKDLMYSKDDQEIMPVDDEEAEDQAEEVADEDESADNSGEGSDDSDSEDEQDSSEDDSEESEEERSEKRLRLIRLKRKARIIADFEKRIGSL